MTHEAIKKAELWRYSVLAVPIAFAGFPLYVLAPDYYATTHGVSLALLGFLLLFLRLFDAFIDPLVGHLSDKYRSLSAGFMALAAGLLCVGMFALFNLLPIHPAVWFSICVATAVTGYSVLSINLNTLGGLWTKDESQQTRISAIREACGLVGLVVAVSLPSLLKKQFPESQAYLIFTLVLAFIMLTAWLFFRPWLSKHLSSSQVAEKPAQSFLAAIRSTPRYTRSFLIVYGLSMLASSIPAVLVIFFVRDLLNAESMTGLFLLLYFLSGALAMPLWRRLSAGSGNYRAWMLAMLLSVASFVWAFFLGAGDIWQYAAICIFSGLALGADLALPPAILASQIHHAENQGHAAIHYALLALVAKLSLAFASAIALPLLAQAGFVPAAGNSESALFALSIGYALIPCVFKLVAACYLWRMTGNFKQGDGSYEDYQAHRHNWGSHHA